MMAAYGFPLTANEIAGQMTGAVTRFDNGRTGAILPSLCVQNHAAFLHRGADGILQCAWFAGGLEGKADICIYRSCLDEEKGLWSPPEALSNDPQRSEQNPVLFASGDARTLLFHTAQPGGNQDQCIVRMRALGHQPVDLGLPMGSFVRACPLTRADGAWLLPLHHCTHVPGARWTGRHDYAAVAISHDKGKSWLCRDVPQSTGCVHMTLVPAGGDRILAFFRRRQADYVYMTASDDGGESWAVPQATNIPNNNSSISAAALADGRIALVCNPVNAEMSSARRQSLYDELGSDSRPEADGGCTAIWGVPRAPLSLFFSSDGGRSFGNEIQVWNSPGTCLTNDSEDGNNHELSYPFMLPAENGDLDIAFTLHRRAIAYVRIPSSEFESKSK